MLPWQPASKTLHKLKVPMNVKNQFLDKVECLHQIIKQLSLFILTKQQKIVLILEFLKHYKRE
jgi:hypothetical protein